MQSRRTRPLWDRKSEAITPTPRPPMGQLTRDELIAQNLDLKTLLSAERRRNAKIEAILIKQLDTQQASLEAVREAFFEQVAPKPTGSRQ